MDATTTLEAKVDALTRKFDLLITETASESSKPVMLCETCGGGHNASQCPLSGTSVAPMEQADFVRGGQSLQGNPYSAIHNPRWRYHPNFQWRGQGPQG